MSQQKIIVISHACIRQINRSVYRELSGSVGELRLIIPASIETASGMMLHHEPLTTGDPEFLPLPLRGRNPRTYFYVGLLDQLDRHQPDLVILENDPVSRLGFMISSWCARNQKKIICQTYENTRRDLKSTLTRQGWKRLPKNLLIYFLNLWMAKRITALLVVNRESETIFGQYGYRNILRIPLGYDKTVFYPNGVLRNNYRTELKVSSDRVLISYFGRMNLQKGVHLLISALADLKAYDWILLIDHAFDPHDRYSSYIHSLISDCKLTERVRYFDANHFEIANYMRAADIMVAPSVTTKEFKEQYGRAVQEAMACGCVTLVSDSGHLPDLVDDPKLVFRENNRDALKDILVKWVVDKVGRESYKIQLANRASKELTSTRQAEMLVQLITHWESKVR